MGVMAFVLYSGNMKLFTNYKSIIAILCVLSTAGFALAGLFYYLGLELRATHNSAMASAKEREALLNTRVTELLDQYEQTLDALELTQEERNSLEDELEDERDRVEEIEDEYDRINSTVSDLLKLSQTDEELLQKYSRIYFLNENYIPSNLETIDSKYVSINKALQIHGDVWPFLEEMLEDAEDDGIELRIASAYRSFDYQAELKTRYLTIYGSGANQFSADQGYSEHQLGSTVDFTSSEVGMSIDTGFENTEAFRWLEDNAHKYGFTLSYPKGNSYYQYEPWHWRFVGRDLADDLHDDNQHFYDLPQRDIDEYLLEIFD